LQTICHVDIEQLTAWRILVHKNTRRVSFCPTLCWLRGTWWHPWRCPHRSCRRRSVWWSWSSLPDFSFLFQLIPLSYSPNGTHWLWQTLSSVCLSTITRVYFITNSQVIYVWLRLANPFFFSSCFESRKISRKISPWFHSSAWSGDITWRSLLDNHNCLVQSHLEYTWLFTSSIPSIISNSWHDVMHVEFVGCQVRTILYDEWVLAHPRIDLLLLLDKIIFSLAMDNILSFMIYSFILLSPSSFRPAHIISYCTNYS